MNEYNKESIRNFLDDIVQSFEKTLIQQPTTSHIIASVDELRSLEHISTFWIEKLLLSDNIDKKTWDKIVSFGSLFFTRYRVPISDIVDIIDSIQKDLLLAIEKHTINVDFEHLFYIHKSVVQLISKGYFEAIFKEYFDELTNSNSYHKQGVHIHIKWLYQLKEYYKNPQSTPPEFDHTLCGFATWLQTLEAQLLFFSSEQSRPNIYASILLTHRKVHDSANYVHSYLEKENYIKALHNLSIFYQSFLRLDKYLNELDYLYQENAYDNFLHFVEYQSNRTNNLYYYYVLDYSKFRQLEEQTIKDIEIFYNKFKEQLEHQNINYIKFKNSDSIHFVIEKKPIVSEDYLNQLVHNSINSLAKNDSSSFEVLSRNINVNMFTIEHIKNYEKGVLKGILQHIRSTSQAKKFNVYDKKRLEIIYSKLQDDKELLSSLKNAISHRELNLHYQPIVEDKKHFNLVETLVRLKHKENIIIADNFIHLVEEYNLTLDLDYAVFDLVLQDLHQIAKIVKNISINIYPSSLQDSSFIEKIILVNQECKKLGLNIVIELTEHTVTENIDILENLSQNHGISFAIDDFGTGYSNMLLLVELANKKIIHHIKLDGSLIESINSDKNKFKIVELVCIMAKTLGLQPVIAEYVDNEEKLQTLQRMDSEILYQGHYFFKALPLNVLETLK